jgi:hypothetical protein
LATAKTNARHGRGRQPRMTLIGVLMLCVSVVWGWWAWSRHGDGHPAGLSAGAGACHLDLGGGVLFLFGLYDRPVPAADRTVLARAQSCLRIVAASCSCSGSASPCSPTRL